MKNILEIRKDGNFILAGHFVTLQKDPCYLTTKLVKRYTNSKSFTMAYLKLISQPNKYGRITTAISNLHLKEFVKRYITK